MDKKKHQHGQNIPLPLWQIHALRNPAAHPTSDQPGLLPVEVSEPCAGGARGRARALPRALVQTQTARALYRLAVFPAGVISSSTLAGRVRGSSCAKRLIDRSETSHGSTSGLGGNGRPVCRGERAFTCSAASALGRAWRRIRWLQGDNFWRPGVVLPSLDISALSRVLLHSALTEMCVSAGAASVWSHGDVDEQLAPT